MAFSVPPIVTLVDDGIVRLTGCELLENEFGTIGLFESTLSPEVRLPAAFKPRPYSGSGNQIVSLQDSVQVAVSSTVQDPVVAQLGIGKTGVDPSDFIITVGPVSGLGPSTAFEIYIRFH